MPPSSSTKPNFLPRLNQLTRPFAIRGLISSLPVSPSKQDAHRSDPDPCHSLRDPLLRRLEVREGGVVWSIEPAEAGFQVPVPGRTLVLVERRVNTATSRCPSVRTNIPSSSLPVATRTG